MAYAWNRTREQVRDMVLRKLGVLGIGDDATPEDAAIVDEAMNARLKELYTLGVLWWSVAATQTQLTVAAAASSATVTAEDFLYPISATLTVTTEQQPLEIIDHRTYQAIPDKATTGRPERVFFKGGVARFWPVPTENETVNLTYQAIAADTATNTALDVPAAAMRAFVDLVAGDLVDDFGVPDSTAARLMVKQAAAVKTIRMVANQRVDTVTVTPDYY